MGRNIIVLLFWNTIWFYHVLVRESSMSSWGAGFDQSFKMPTSFRIVSFSWGTKTICFWKPSAISSLRKKSWKRKKPPAAGLQPFGPLSARGAPAWQESSARSGPEPEHTGLVWSPFLVVVNKELVREKAAYLLGNSFRHKSMFPNRSISPMLSMFTNSYFFNFLIC